MKKMVSLMMSLALVLGSTTVAFAAPNKDKSLNVQGSALSGYTEMDSKQTNVSDVLNYDQMVALIAKDKNITKTEASTIVIGPNPLGSPIKTDGIQNGVSTNYQAALTATYRTVSSQFTVNSLYKPWLKFYCKTSEGGGFYGLEKILNISMDRNYLGMSKTFGGSVYANLEDGGTIYWIVNGDFYNNGSTSVSGGVDIGLGEFGSINFGASYATSHYAYCYKTGYFIVR
jgi:hypothetical protein